MEWKTETYDLLYPLDQKRVGEGEEPVTSYTIAEPDLDQMERIEAIGLEDDDSVLKTAALRQMIVIMTEMTEGQVKRLHFKDVERIGDQIEPFMAQEPTGSDNGTETAATKS